MQNKVYIGIFYYITTDFKTGKLICNKSEVSNLTKTKDAYTSGYHVDLWSEIQPSYSLPTMDHEYYPRGRVNFMIDYLEVIADKCIINIPDFKTKLESSFLYKKYIYIKERKAHYSCYKCNKNLAN